MCPSARLDNPLCDDLVIHPWLCEIRENDNMAISAVLGLGPLLLLLFPRLYRQRTVLQETLGLLSCSPRRPCTCTFRQKKRGVNRQCKGQSAGQHLPKRASSQHGKEPNISQYVSKRLDPRSMCGPHSRPLRKDQRRPEEMQTSSPGQSIGSRRPISRYHWRLFPSPSPFRLCVSQHGNTSSVHLDDYNLRSWRWQERQGG